tara:strand:- start:90 stop:212 length:123 start_codon:yes stop_codon:yes gene_type:complete
MLTVESPAWDKFQVGVMWLLLLVTLLKYILFEVMIGYVFE